MQLLTKALIKRFQEVGSQERNPDPLVIARFFLPEGAATWYATEYNSEGCVFFGYVTLFGLGSIEDEWGSFSLDELLRIRGPVLRLPVERDRFFTEARFSVVMQHERFQNFKAGLFN